MKKISLISIVFVSLVLLSLFNGQILNKTETISKNSTINNPIKVSDSINLSTFENKSTSFEDQAFPRIALVKPVFTATAYSSFYTYYPNPTLDPRNYLSFPIRDNWGTSLYGSVLKDVLVSDGYPSNRITIISDISVHKNLLYDSDGNKLYDVLVFFHSEYVTIQEYTNTLQFIATGGNVIVANGNAFYAEVVYNETTNNLTLVRGHGFDFDGVKASPTPSYRFYNYLSNDENPRFIGSTYCHIATGSFKGGTFNIDPLNPNPISLDMTERGYNLIADTYVPHEENCLETKNAQIIINWKLSDASRGEGYKMYETFPMGPLGGSLIHFGIFSSDIISYDKTLLATFIDCVRHQMGYFKTPWIRYPVNGGVYSDKNLIIDFTPYWKHEIYLNGSLIGNFQAKTSLGYLSEGTYNLTILFNLLHTNITRTSIFSIDRSLPQIEFNSNNKVVTNLTVNPLIINIADSHPEDVNYCIYSDVLMENNKFCIENAFYHVTENNSTLQMFINKPLPNGTYYIDIKAYDSAYNFNESVFKFYIGKPGNNIILIKRPQITQINDTTVKISIAPLSMNMSAYLFMTSKFTVSANYSTWFRENFTNFDSITNQYYFYYNKPINSSFFLYKLFVYNSTTNATYNYTSAKYIPELGSYYWNNNLIIVKTSDIQRNIAKNELVTVTIDNRYNTSQKGVISLIDGTSSINSSIIQYFNSNNSKYSIDLNLSNLTLKNGFYNLEITFFSDSNMSFDIPFILPLKSNPIAIFQYKSLQSFIKDKNNKTSYTIGSIISQNTILYFMYKNATFQSIIINSATFDITVFVSTNATISIIYFDPISNIYYEYIYSLFYYLPNPTFSPSSSSSTNISSSFSSVTSITSKPKTFITFLWFFLPFIFMILSLKRRKNDKKRS